MIYKKIIFFILIKKQKTVLLVKQGLVDTKYQPLTNAVC